MSIAKTWAAPPRPAARDHSQWSLVKTSAVLRPFLNPNCFAEMTLWGLHETGYLTIDNCFHHFGYDRQQRHRSVVLRQVLGFLLVNGCDSSCLPGMSA